MASWIEIKWWITCRFALDLSVFLLICCTLRKFESWRRNITVDQLMREVRLENVRKCIVLGPLHKRKMEKKWFINRIREINIGEDDVREARPAVRRGERNMVVLDSAFMERREEVETAYIAYSDNGHLSNEQIDIQEENVKEGEERGRRRSSKWTTSTLPAHLPNTISGDTTSPIYRHGESSSPLSTDRQRELQDLAMFELESESQISTIVLTDTKNSLDECLERQKKATVSPRRSRTLEYMVYPAPYDRVHDASPPSTTKNPPIRLCPTLQVIGNVQKRVEDHLGEDEKIIKAQSATNTFSNNETRGMELRIDPHGEFSPGERRKIAEATLCFERLKVKKQSTPSHTVKAASPKYASELELNTLHRAIDFQFGDYTEKDVAKPTSSHVGKKTPDYNGEEIRHNPTYFSPLPEFSNFIGATPQASTEEKDKCFDIQQDFDTAATYDTFSADAIRRGERLFATGDACTDSSEIEGSVPDMEDELDVNESVEEQVEDQEDEEEESDDQDEEWEDMGTETEIARSRGDGLSLREELEWRYLKGRRRAEGSEKLDGFGGVGINDLTAVECFIKNKCSIKRPKSPPFISH